MNTKLCPTCKSPIPANAPGGLCPACVLRDADEPAPAGRAAPSLAEVSAAFPQLEVLGLIGQGGMGFVYKVRQPSLDRTVALKILSPELGRDPAFAERFAREARVLGKLNHPNIVTVFESGESGGFFYLIMEYVDGVNLRQAMRAARFTPQQALAVVPGICDALQAAHAQGVWHRDIKPENILLDARGGVKIADFGIARIVGDPERDFTLTATGAALGSAAYMAPEQHEKPHDVDHRADIYSLGVVIYEMLTGELPLGRFPAPSQRAAVDARIDEIVFRTLEKERELRQQSATEVKTDMQGAATAAEPAREKATPAGTVPLTRLPELVRWSLALLIAGGVLLVVAFNTATSVANHFGGTSAWSVIMHMNKLGDTEGLNLDGLMAFWPGTMVFVLGVLGCVWSFVGTERRKHQNIALEKERELRQQSATEVKTEMDRAQKSSASGLPLLHRSTGDAAGQFLFLLAAGLIGGGVFLGLTGLSLRTSHETAATILSILGRFVISLGFVTAAYGTYSRKPRAWVAGLGVFISLAVVFVLGSGLFNGLMIIGFLVVAGVLGTVGFLNTKRAGTKHKFHPPSAPEEKTDVQNAVPENDSSLTRLPRLVRWSLGLLVGGGALMGAGALVAESFKTQQTTSMMALLIALGGVASAAGFLGSLWSLYEMKRGWMATTGRWLLIVLTIVPLAVGAIIMGGGVGFVAPIPLPPEKGSVLKLMGFYYVFLSLALGVIFLLARPLQPATPLRRRLGPACLALAACAAVGSALLAKRHDYHWPHVFYSEEAKLKLFSDLRPQDDQVLALLKRAASPFADDYELSVSNGVARVVALTRQDPLRGERGPGRNKYRDFFHASACLARLRDLLPPSAVHESVTHSDESSRDPNPRNALAVLASLAALLAALAGGRRAVWVVVGGVALHGVLIALPVWPSGNAAPPRLIDAAPLPPLTVAELPAPDFSTPENAVMSVYDAACFGRLEVVNRGMSKALVAALDEKDAWAEFMKRHRDRRFAVLPGKLVERDGGKAVAGTFITRDGRRTGDGGPSLAVLEDGEWRLDNVIGADFNNRLNRPHTSEAKKKAAATRSAPTLEARIKETEDSMRDPDKVATPRARVENAAPPAPLALGATPVEDAMQALLKAAREKDRQALRAGTSRSLRAIADDDGPMGALNDLRRLTFVRARTLNETTAEVILRSTDAAGKEREIPFQMIMEDGAWKLTEVGHSTPTP